MFLYRQDKGNNISHDNGASSRTLSYDAVSMEPKTATTPEPSDKYKIYIANGTSQSTECYMN